MFLKLMEWIYYEAWLKLIILLFSDVSWLSLPLSIGSANFSGMYGGSPELCVKPSAINGRPQASEAIVETWSWGAGYRDGQGQWLWLQTAPDGCSLFCHRLAVWSCAITQTGKGEANFLSFDESGRTRTAVLVLLMADIILIDWPGLFWLDGTVVTLVVQYFAYHPCLPLRIVMRT